MKKEKSLLVNCFSKNGSGDLIYFFIFYAYETWKKKAFFARENAASPALAHNIEHIL